VIEHEQEAAVPDMRTAPTASEPDDPYRSLVDPEQPAQTLEDRLERLQFPTAFGLLVLGGIAWIANLDTASTVAFAAATVVALVPATIHSIRQLIRRDATADVVAVLAMIGALLLGEWLAGAIIAVMLTGGEALEARAAGRARSELTGLLRRAPRTAHRQTDDGTLEDVPIGSIQVGDHLVVKVGEVVPVDGTLRSERAVLDTSALTGESRPVELHAGQQVNSGVVNAGGPLELRAMVPASESTYAGIVRLVEQAASERAPFVRLADRFAAWFLGITLLLAGAAWAVSGDPVRALAVLVVATPCPLILAAPAAIVGGVSAAAKRGIIVKGGGALESLAGGEVVLLDKTGTITSGRPRVAQVHQLADLDTTDVLRLAGSLDQVSVHPFAPAIVEAAHARVGELTLPSEVIEDLGRGIRGRVDGHHVRIGQLPYAAGDASITAATRRVRRRSGLEGRSVVYVAVDDRLVGAITLHDPVRPDTPRSLQAVRDAGIKHVLMVTGDRTEIAELVGDSVGVDQVLAERSPDEKVSAVREAAALGRTIMVGDGINDAPALALADTGVAMGARGATAASEAAEVVLTSDRLIGLAEAITIAKRTRRIAWQSAVVGIGLSAIAMVVAAAGYLPPVAGALVQEVIDLAVIANALRALRFPGSRTVRGRDIPRAPAARLAEHEQLAARLEDIATTAEQLDARASRQVMHELQRVRSLLVDEILPHELAEEDDVYPAVRAAFPGQDPTASLRRAHREIARRIRLLDRLIAEVGDDGPDDEEIIDLQRALFGLHAVLEVHVALEDELFGQLTTS
jgi:heavy metal translocating P-type ATPase